MWKVFNFVYLHIILRPKFFLVRSHQMFLQLYLSVVVFKTCLFHTQSHVTLTAPHKNFCHTPGLTHMTPQLYLRLDRPMFAAADFKPSDMQFNIRWSTYWPW